MNYDAILFDLDGTLIKTIHLYEIAFIQALEEVGVHVKPEEFHSWYISGFHLKDILKMNDMVEEDVPQLRPRRDEIYEDLLAKKSEWLPGAEDILSFCKKNFPLAIITGSWRKYIDAINKKLPIYTYVDTFVTAAEMGHFMKPHPHGLLIAADMIGVDPEKCLYVGDQIFDVEACKAAGMKSCIVEGQYTPEAALETANIRVKSMKELLKIVQS